MTSIVHEGAGELGMKLVARMDRLTWDRFGELALANARANRDLVNDEFSLERLTRERVGKGDSAIVIAAGPSIKRHDPAAEIKAAGYDGAIVATESAMLYCLRNGIVPDLAVTVDPHPTRIVRWLGDPNLSAEKLAQDDYFARQDQDAAFKSELAVNAEVLDLLNCHGRDIRMALSVTSSRPVVERVLEVGFQIYWWIPMLDDPDIAGSVTAQLQDEFGLPSVNAGGNVGSATWMMAAAALNKKHVALTGMDFSYYEGTPYRNTQYYHEAVAMVGEENLDSIYMRVHNPYLDQWFFTDPAYMWYRQCFLEMVGDSDCRTYNCTEGGILFGGSIEFVLLSDFLAARGRPGPS